MRAKPLTQLKCMHTNGKSTGSKQEEQEPPYSRKVVT